MNLQKKRFRTTVHEEPYNTSHSKRQRLNQYSEAGFIDSPIRPLGHHHNPSSVQHQANESDDIIPMSREPQAHYPSHTAGVGFCGRVESAKVEPQQNHQNSSFFPSSSDFKVVDSHFHSFRDHISTGNVIINMNTGSSASNNKLEVPQVEAKPWKQPMQNVHPVVRKSSEVYYRHLLTLGRGSPLWIPEPSTSLPVEYQKAGIGIGDVGILKDSGGFDFLFNVYLPPNDAKHRINPRTMPDGFHPLDAPEERDVNGHAEFKNHSFLASSHVDSRPYKSSGFVFESSAADGAILTMPNGANSIDLDNMALVRKYVSMNVKQWYTYANEVRGRDARNGDLRLVIGKTSATTWGMATFAKESEDQEISRLKFKATRFGDTGNLACPNYRWEYSGRAEVKSGPDEHEIEKLRRFDRLEGGEGQMAYENQCLFVRTINVTLQDGLHRANDIGELGFREVERDEILPVRRGRRRRKRSWKQISQSRYRDKDRGKGEEDFVDPLQASTHYDSHPGLPPFGRAYSDPAFWLSGTDLAKFEDLGGPSGALPSRSADIPIKDHRTGYPFSIRSRESSPTRDPVFHFEETGLSNPRGTTDEASRARYVSPFTQTTLSVDGAQSCEDDVRLRFRITQASNPPVSSSRPAADGSPPSDSIESPVGFRGALNGAPHAAFTVDISQPGAENESVQHSHWPRVDRWRVSSSHPSSPTREPAVENDIDNADINNAAMWFRPFDWDESIPVLARPANISMTAGAAALPQCLPRTRRTRALHPFNERSPSPFNARSPSPPSPRRAHDPPFDPTESDHGGPSSVLPPNFAIIPVDVLLEEDFSFSSPTKDPVFQPERTGLEDHRGGGTNDPTGDPAFNPTEIRMSGGDEGLQIYHPVVNPNKTELTIDDSSSSASPTTMGHHDDQMPQPHQLGIPGPSKSEAPLATELHPSKIINEYLLNRVPEATMAITEDGDWISVLQPTDTVFPADEVLLSRIKDTYEVCVEEGVVFLRSRTRP